MNFVLLTIFPDMVTPLREYGIIRRAIDQRRIDIVAINVRDFAPDRHHVTDDRPYGGGSGMVMKPEPLAAAVKAAKERFPLAKTLLLSPQGRTFNQQIAGELASLEGLIFVCGRYEGVDERVCDQHIDLEVSIGDYVLTGGELAAMVIIDAVTRLIPGTLGGIAAAEKDSFSDGLLEHAHYTRPPNFDGNQVPEVLLSGNHREIERWRLESSLLRTLVKRKDLLLNRKLDPQELAVLQNWGRIIEAIVHAQSVSGIDPLSGGQ
jgi:tRNA (guanine37-N1)-methyltransferase